MTDTTLTPERIQWAMRSLSDAVNVGAVLEHYKPAALVVLRALHDLTKPEAAAATQAALDTAAERTRQDAKWGEQNHPDGTGPDVRPNSFEYAVDAMPGNGDARRLAEAATNETDILAAGGAVTWLDILREEYYEALAEEDPLALRTELIQLAAVAQQWVEAIDRRAHG